MNLSTNLSFNWARNLNLSATSCHGTSSFTWKRNKKLIYLLITIRISALLYALYARLGRLHRRYFLRGLHSAEYSFSRNTAVDCAEKLLELQAESEAGGTFPYVYSYSMDQHLFSILLIRVIDITIDQDEARAQVRMAEIFKTYKKLEEKQKTLHRSGNGTHASILPMKNASIIRWWLRARIAFWRTWNPILVVSFGHLSLTLTRTIKRRVLRNSEEPSSASHFSFEDDLSELWEEFIANMPNSPTHFSHLDCLESHDFPAGDSDPPCLGSRSKCVNYFPTDNEPSGGHVFYALRTHFNAYFESLPRASEESIAAVVRENFFARVLFTLWSSSLGLEENFKCGGVYGSSR